MAKLPEHSFRNRFREMASDSTLLVQTAPEVPSADNPSPCHKSCRPSVFQIAG